ncbi:MAG: mechanosensitive ion channel, partial [Bilophila sp.]
VLLCVPVALEAAPKTPPATPTETPAPKDAPSASQEEAKAEDETALTEEQLRQKAQEEQAQKEADAKAKLEAEIKAKQDSEEKAKRDAELRTKQMSEEAEQARRQAENTAENTLWDEAFKQNETELNTVGIEVDGLNKSADGIIRPMRRALPSLQEAALRLFSLAGTHKENPMMMEVIDRRGVILALDLRRQVQPLYSMQGMITNLNGVLAQMRRNLPKTDASGETSSGTNGRGLVTPAQAEARNRVMRLESKLERLRFRVEDALNPAEELLRRLDTMHTKIGEYLPVLWKRYYLEMPSRFFDPTVWENSKDHWDKTLSNMTLRLSIEVPRTLASWQGLSLRFLNIFLVGGLLLMFVFRYLKKHCDTNTPNAPRNILRSLVSLLFGLSMLVASVGNGGEMFRTFMVLGSLIFISGEIGLAWELRRLSLRHEAEGRPLWPLFASTLLGTVLSYPDLPEGILSLSWILASAALLYLIRRCTRAWTAMPQLENSLFQIHHIAVWVSLGVAVIGWARMSILFLITVNCLIVSAQLILGAIQIINRCSSSENEKHGVVAAVVAACIAPAGLMLVLVSATLWVIALPGGAKLLWHYLESGVQVGSASFNMLHVLFAISGFYLTRAAILAARSFVARISARSQRLDNSLIPPLQTGITYGFWSLFGLFALHSLGFGVANLAVIAGGLSVGIGFGMQAIVNNFISGLILIFSRTLHEGDVVDVGGVQGTVRKINVRATTVETFDNALI